MAKTEEPYTISAKQLFELRKNRKVITSVLSADIGLGGGIPLGCCVIFGGKPKSGKTSCSLTYAAKAQKDFKSKVFFANIEGRLDNKVLSQIDGLDMEKVEVVMGPPIEDKEGNIIGNKKMSAQQWWAKIGELITNNPNSVIIVDSISALSDEAELTEGMGFMSRGGLQKLESQFARQYGDLIVANGITLFLLAQVQSDTSGKTQGLQIKCGNAFKHMADAIIFIKWCEKWTPNSDGRILGHNMHWSVECSPLGAPFIDTTVALRFGKGLDRNKDLVLNGLNWGLMKLTGAWYILPFRKGDTKFKIEEIPQEKKEQDDFIKCQGEENARQWLIENPQAADKIESSIRQRIFG